MEKKLKSFGYHRDHISKSQLIDIIEDLQRPIRDEIVDTNDDREENHKLGYLSALNDIITLIKQ